MLCLPEVEPNGHSYNYCAVILRQCFDRSIQFCSWYLFFCQKNNPAFILLALFCISYNSSNSSSNNNNKVNSNTKIHKWLHNLNFNNHRVPKFHNNHLQQSKCQPLLCSSLLKNLQPPVNWTQHLLLWVYCCCLYGVYKWARDGVRDLEKNSWDCMTLSGY